MNLKNIAYVLLSIVTVDRVYGMEQRDNDICEAAKVGNLALVQDLVVYGTDVDTKNYNGSTALHFAAEGGHKEVVEWLINNRADINAQGHRGNTALHWGIHYLEIIKFLLDNGADIDAVNKLGNTALSRASITGNEDAVRVLLEYGADVRGRYNNTALHCAAGKDHFKIVKLLLEKGTVNIDAVNNYGDTALHSASYKQKADAARILIENGADVNIQNQVNKTALSYSNLLITQMLIDAGANVIGAAVGDLGVNMRMDQARDIQERVKSAILDNDVAQLRKLILKKQTYVSGNSILFLSKKYRELLEAVESGNVQKVKELYEQGLPLTLRWKNGNTLLHVAALANQPAMVDFLLRQGMDVSATNDSGQTVVHLAVDKHVNLTGQKSVLDVIVEFASGVAWKSTAGSGKRVRDAM